MSRLLLILLMTYTASALGAELRQIDMETMSAEVVEQACRLEGLDYGNRKVEGKPHFGIHPECHKYIEKIATPFQRAESGDGKIRVLAALNIIYTEVDIEENGKPKTLHNIISGPMSSLKSIESITLSKDGLKLAVLQNLPEQIIQTPVDQPDKAKGFSVEKELLIFNARMNGNVIPLKMLRNKEMNGASSVAFHPNGNEIYLANKEIGQILSFSTEADFRMANEEKRPKVKRRITSNQNSFREPSSIDFMDNNLIVLDTNGNRVVALDPLSSAPLWILEKDTIGLDYASHVQYQKHNKKLIISDEQGNSVAFDQQ